MKKKILPHIEEEIIQLALDLIVGGNSLSDTKKELRARKYGVDEGQINTAVSKASALLKKKVLVDVEKIIPIHIELYESIYKEFEQLNYVPGKLKALRCKEKLLGLLKEGESVEIFNQVNVEEEAEKAYDTSKLEKKEKARLEELLKIVSRNVNEGARKSTKTRSIQ